MALSQLQCLDDNHVNPRTHESKPEFFYCEDQRLALEALLRDGREAFVKYLEARGLRGFLSDPELETLTGAVEPYDPGSELFSEDAEDGRTPLSLHYWPEVSDTSIPQMDLGWPDSDAYRGVTRTTVYTQPPLDGQVHVKEVVRKMIAQAQKVIAVVMDVFTDVDIFRDLLDAGFKRRVSVYILLERTTLPHFLSMCQRANMHAGHLKHLRVRCPEGAEFHTRFCTKVRGRMGHRFMFIDGDKAVSGSYSFTWMASRLDRNLITVVTGQAVEGFDRQFRLLYATSTSVDLRQIATKPEPEPDPLPQPVIIAPPSAAVARKLYNPKYALVALTNPSPTTSVNHESPKEPETPENSKKKRRGRASEDAIQEAPPLHPGLINLEKACLISYLPTWPEPDPPSDVIGFINIRNANKPTQFHLQRSEMFETSQAIRFSSPFSKAEKTLPEVAKPTHLGAKQPEQDKSKAGGVLDKAQLSDVKNIQEAPENKSPASGQKSELETTKTVSAENKFDSNTTTNQDGGLDAASLSPHTPPQSSSKALSPNEEKTSHTAEPVSTNSQTGSDSLQESNTEKEAESISILNPQCSVVYRTHTLTLNSTHTSELPDSPELNTEQDTEEKTGPSQPDSHTQAIHRQPQISSEMASNTQTPTVHSNISTSSASATQSKNNHIPITILHSSASTGASAPSTSSSSLSPPTSSFTTLNSPLPSPPPAASSPLTSTPPVPKPRTVQLVISDNSASSGQKLPDIYLVRKPEASTGPLVVHTVLDVAQTSLVKECQSVPELQDDSASKIGALKDTKNTENSKEIPKQETESKETRSIKTDGQDDDIVESQMVTGTDLQTQSDVLIIDSPKAASLNIQQIIPKDPQTSKDCRTAEKMDMDCVATVQADTKASEKTLTGYEFDKVPDEKGETQSRTFLNRAHEPQRISYCKLTPQDMSQLQALNSLKAPSYSLHASKDCMGTSAVDTYSQQGKQARVTHSDNTESIINTAKHNTHSTTQEQISTARVSTHTPEKTLRLHLTETHLPDFRSQTTEPELRSLTVRIPTPDGFFPRTPTPDSRTTTPDPRSYTSDYRTPTPDGYVSSREDSTLSTTSEEYFECSDSPFSEPVFDHMVYHNHEARGDHVSFTHTNIPHAAITGTSPAHSETQTKPTRLSSSSLLGKKVKMREAENTTNEENGSEEDKRGRKLSVDEKREEQEPRGTATVGSEETNRTVDHFEQDSTETAEKDKLVQVPVRKVVLNQDVADRLVDGGVTSGDSTKARTTPKHSSMGEPKPAIVSSEGERPDKESSGRQRSVERRQRSVERRQMSVERRQRSVERRQSPQSTRRTEGQKLLHTSPKLQRGKQRDRGASSPTQSPNSPRTGSAMQPLGPRPWVNRQPNQTESKEPQSSQNLSSLRKSPPRPPSPVRVGPVGSVAGRKQVSHSQQSNAPVLQGGIRTGQTQNQTPYIKPHTSLLHTNLHTPLSPQSHNQMASAKEAHGQEGRTPFSFTLSRLYNLKGMKAKVNKNPAQSKRGSVTAPVHERKSTS